MDFTGSKTKISRRLGLALTPCAAKIMGNRPYPPGQHGPMQQKGGRKVSDYKRQLTEKQRLRAQYQISEKQMRNYARAAMKKQGDPAEHLIHLLETRLDSVVFRAGFARTVSAARQFVNHRHILVGGRWGNIASQRIPTDTTVSVKEASWNLPCFIAAREEMVGPVPHYLERDPRTLSVKLISCPHREEVPISCDMPLVIEYYSR